MKSNPKAPNPPKKESEDVKAAFLVSTVGVGLMKMAAEKLANLGKKK